MRRLPNPWFLIPVVVAGAVGGIVGRTVAHVACTVDPDRFQEGVRGCPGWEIGTGIVAALVAMAGVAVVLVLVFRSIAEHREYVIRGVEPPGAGCETGSDDPIEHHDEGSRRDEQR